MIALLELGPQAGVLLVQPTGRGPLAIERLLQRRAARALCIEFLFKHICSLLEALELFGQRSGRRAEWIRRGRLRPCDFSRSVDLFVPLGNSSGIRLGFSQRATNDSADIRA